MLFRSQLVALKLANRRRLGPSGLKGSFGKYLRIHGVICLLHFSALNWSRDALTPLWLRIIGPDWPRPDALIRKHIAARAGATGVQAIAAAEGTEIPLFLRTGVAREDVFASVLAELVRIADWLQEVAVASPDDSIPLADATALELPPEDQPRAPAE